MECVVLAVEFVVLPGFAIPSAQAKMGTEVGGALDVEIIAWPGLNQGPADYESHPRLHPTY
jgi:hypothetical protein